MVRIKEGHDLVMFINRTLDKLSMSQCFFMGIVFGACILAVMVFMGGEV